MVIFPLSYKTAFLTAALLIIASGLLTPGCLDIADNGPLDIVIVSILPQKEMVKAIAGPDIKVVVMVPSGQSVHSYSPTPGQLKDVSRGDIYFKVGSGVEFETNHLSTLIENNPRMEVVDCSKGIELRSFDEHFGASDHENDEHEGNESTNDDDHHHHEGSDPHIWLSPSNMRIMAEVVRDSLIISDPDHAETYRSNYDSYVSKLNEVITEIGDLLSPFEGMEFMVYHPAWGYFGDEFKLVQLAIEEAGTKPGPQGIAAIIEQAKAQNISVIFVEPQFDSSAASTIASEIGGRVVISDPLAENYQENILEMAKEMKAGYG
jgi:zinc transport system substrate-binding protein